MKTILTTIIFLAGTGLAIAQQVGIGTVAPDDLLHIKGGDLRVEHSGFPKIKLYKGSVLAGALEVNGNSLWLSNELSGKMHLRIAGSAKMSISSAGHVGIGTTSPVEKLHVMNGDFRFEGPNEFMDIRSTDPSFPNGIRFYDGASFLGGMFFSPSTSGINLTNSLSNPGLVLDMATNRVGVGTLTPGQSFAVDGKIAVGDDANAATAGAIRFKTPENIFQGYDGSQWLDGLGTGHWSKSGTKVYYEDGAVLVGRSTTIGSERFGVRYPVASAAYGGMYMETNGHAGGKPFYGYAIDNTAQMWHYYDGASSDWRVYNAGNRLTVENNGEVGIGTIDPDAPLHVWSQNNWDLSSTEGDFKIGNGSHRLVMGVATGGVGAGTSRIYAKGGDQRLILGAGSSDAMSILANGRVGIGLQNPLHALHVYRASSSYNVMFESDNGAPDLVLDHSAGTTSNSTLTFTAGGAYKGSMGYDPDDEYIFIYEGGNVLIGQDGRLGVGIIPNVNYKLSVDGKIIGEEVKVQLSQNWPDYVFTEEYALPTMSELRKHIDEHGHLPGIPSASDIEHSEGFELGEMNRILVEKVEELTLYILQQDERIKSLESKLADDEK